MRSTKLSFICLLLLSLLQIPFAFSGATPNSGDIQPQQPDNHDNSTTTINPTEGNPSVSPDNSQGKDMRKPNGTTKDHKSKDPSQSNCYEADGKPKTAGVDCISPDGV